MKRAKTQSLSIGFVPIGDSLIEYAEQRAYEEIGHEAHPHYNTDQSGSKSTKSSKVRKKKSN